MLQNHIPLLQGAYPIRVRFVSSCHGVSMKAPEVSRSVLRSIATLPHPFPALSPSHNARRPRCRATAAGPKPKDLVDVCTEPQRRDTQCGDQEQRHLIVIADSFRQILSTAKELGRQCSGTWLAGLFLQLAACPSRATPY